MEMHYEKLNTPEDALDDSSTDASDLDTPDDGFDLVLSSQSGTNTSFRHPQPERIQQLWRVYVENIDPLTKVVHVPTLQPAIHKAASNFGTIPRGFEALLFAIYSAAVMSMKHGECNEKFGEPRETLLSRYISATKAALSRARFMSTASLVVLQALVILIHAVRDIYEPRAVWSLTGVAIRIAQSMGLERDGIYTGLPPFEAEMRRRIWWLLKTHDFRTAELCGLPKFRDLDTSAESTKWPTNINDDQIYPGMPSLLAESNTLTDLVFVAMRYELANLAAGHVARFRRQGKDLNQWHLHSSEDDRSEMDRVFKDFEEILETKYLRYCDPSQPLHLMTMLVARLASNNVRFLTHHPRRWVSIEQTPLSERQGVWEVSIKLLEQHIMLQTNPLLKRYAWYAPYYMQWHAFIHILDTLRVNPLVVDSEKAWQLIRNMYENNPDMVNMRKPIHVAVGNLCLKAYNVYMSTPQHTKMGHSPTPEFISELRLHRDMAKNKKQARNTRSSQPMELVNHAQASNRINTSESTDLTPFQHSPASDGSGLTQTNNFSENDPFWFVQGLDDNQFDNVVDTMNKDLDATTAQDPRAEGSATHLVNWKQWDAWLAE
ncbi:MAG: hypothetical protein Q9213_004767 [Squamulea squamosa]